MTFDPTKEDWRADADQLVVAPHIGSIMATFYATDPYGPPEDTIARVRLASAAPDMALAALKWLHGEISLPEYVLLMDAALRKAGAR